jgi:hypothetical protein
MNLQRLYKLIFVGMVTENSGQGSRSLEAQRLVDEATTANKRSRLQVFEVNPGQGRRTVLINKYQRQWAVKALFLVGLLAAVAVFTVLPA